MNDVIIEKHFSQSQELVFDFLSKSEHILKWWGPEGGTVPDHSMELGEIGPWFAKMKGTNGENYHVRGEVTAVDRPNSIDFTWGWVDEHGQRGEESYVRFEVAASPDGGSKFRLIHTELPSEESARNHNIGWTYSLDRLEKLVG